MRHLRAICLVLTVCALPVTAAAEPASCKAQITDDAGRMRCDIDRAAEIRNEASRLHGPVQGDPKVESVDTTSPSGAAYVYTLFDNGPRTRLEARSVPGEAKRGIFPACSLSTSLADDTANSVAAALTRISEKTLPAYGAREEVTINPDGSRSVRLIIDSHDIITTIRAGDRLSQFSRHAGSEDDITRLNNLVIGVANISSGWSCSVS